jgi:hypothetical protein
MEKLVAINNKSLYIVHRNWEEGMPKAKIYLQCKYVPMGNPFPYTSYNRTTFTVDGALIRIHFCFQSGQVAFG